MSTPASKIVFFLTACEVTALQDLAIESSAPVGWRTIRSLVKKGLIEPRSVRGSATLSTIGCCLLPVLPKTSQFAGHSRPYPQIDQRQICLPE
jgi:hypothetical protein